MLRPTASAFALAVSLFAAGIISAEDQGKGEKAKPSGTWAREASGHTVKVEFATKEKVILSVFAGENGVIATCAYSADKDGVVKAKITQVDEKGTFKNKPSVGLEFTFKWSVKGSTGTLDDLKGDELDRAKPVLEGEYQRKTDKK